LDSIANEPAAYKISHLASRLFFRGIYFPQKGAWQWLKLIAQNRGSVWSVLRDSFTRWHGSQDGAPIKVSTAVREAPTEASIGPIGVPETDPRAEI
jgi:hypothetical protein